MGHWTKLYTTFGHPAKGSRSERRRVNNEEGVGRLEEPFVCRSCGQRCPFAGFCLRCREPLVDTRTKRRARISAHPPTLFPLSAHRRRIARARPEGPHLRGKIVSVLSSVERGGAKLAAYATSTIKRVLCPFCDHEHRAVVTEQDVGDFLVKTEGKLVRVGANDTAIDVAGESNLEVGSEVTLFGGELKIDPTAEGDASYRDAERIIHLLCATDTAPCTIAAA